MSSANSSSASPVCRSTVVCKHLTLVLLLDAVGNRVLLGKKKRGFGAGKLNGFGGKVEPGETIVECAVREMEEESGLRVKNPSYRGFLHFDFQGREDEVLEVHVFLATEWEGSPVESDEMAPEWFDAGCMPYDGMWKDDKYWMPLLLNGERFEGVFLFRGHEEILSYTLSKKESMTLEVDKFIPLPLGSASQASISI